MYKIVKKTCDTLLFVILIALLAFVGILAVPQLLGYRAYAVLTPSMAPAYPVGSIVYAKAVQAEEIHTGDVIVFAAGGFDMPVTHRVLTVDTIARHFITKGDNNTNTDFAPVAFESVSGRVAGSVPFLGSLVTVVRSVEGVFILGILALWLLLLFAIPSFFKPPAQNPPAPL